MRNILCVIDDKTIFVKHMLESLSLYCKDNNQDFDAEFVIVSVNDSFRERFVLEDEEQKPYSIENLKEEMFERIPFGVLNLKLKDISVINNISEFLQDIKTNIELKEEDNIFFLINHGCFIDIDTKLLKENMAGMSMKLYDEILNENHKCLMYTSLYYSEEVRKAWKNMFKLFVPNRKVPEFFERETLYPSYFKVKTAKKIIEEFKGK